MLSFGSRLRKTTAPPLLGLFLLCSCTPAALISDEKITFEPGFSVEAPDPDHWILRKNRLWQDQAMVVYRHEERRWGALSFRRLDYPEDMQPVPLAVLAEAYFMTRGVGEGIEAEVLYTDEILLDGQRAAVVFGTETIRPITQSICQVMTLSPDGILIVRLIADPMVFESLTPEFDRILRSFRFNHSKFVDPYLLDVVPMEDPEHDPGRFDF